MRTRTTTPYLSRFNNVLEFSRWMVQTCIRQKFVSLAHSVPTCVQKDGQGCQGPTQLPTTTSGHLKYDTKMAEQHGEIKCSNCREPHSFQNPNGWIFSQTLSSIGELLERGEFVGLRHIQTHAHIRALKRELKTTSTQTGIKKSGAHINSSCPQGIHAKTAKSIWRQLSQMLRLQQYIAESLCLFQQKRFRTVTI